MGETLERKLTKKRILFQEAMRDIVYTDEQRVVFQNAIDSVNYIIAIYAGQVLLPSLNEDSQSDWGMVHEWMSGSFRNIQLAENILNGNAAESDEIARLKARIKELEAKDAVMRGVMSELRGLVRDSSDVLKGLNPDSTGNE